MKKLFPLLSYFLLAVLFLIPSGPVSAEIRNPYVVDEKSPVLFGDSIEVSGYHGLENYKLEYVGEYAHITFTYTHNGWNYANYPPRLYVTALDPRATSTPAIRSMAVVYQLMQRTHNPEHTTDWYLYDVQFNATGYTVIVKRGGDVEIFNEHREINGLTGSDWVALANLYPIQELMFSQGYSMSFTPVPIRLIEPEPEIPDPIIIIPGIMDSAYKNAELVIDPILHTYDNLIATLVANGYEEGKDLFTFPYEWRNSNIITAKLLRDKVNEVQSVCKCQTVDLVAHSMGGLVARQYIQSGDYENDVDQLIFLGTPHKGVPKNYLTWEAGEFEPGLDGTLTGLFFEAEVLRNGYLTIFDYIRHRPILSVQELLPVFDYVKDNSTSVIREYPDNYPRNFFLENLNNSVLSLLNSGVKVTNIVGNSRENETIDVIRVIPTDHQIFWEHGEPEGFGAIIGDSGLERGMGDNTVTQLGSVLGGISSEEITASHNRIPTVAEAKIFHILTGKVASTTVDNGMGMDAKVLLLQLLSPIDFVITAPDGKKIGKNFENGSEYDEIPNAFYSGYRTNDEYITILDPLDGEYKIEVQGTDSGGEYEVLTSLVTPSTSTTKEILGLTESGQVTALEVSLDHSNPESIAPEKIVTLEVLLTDVVKSYELGWIKDEKTRDELIKKVQKIYKNDKKAGKNLAKVLSLDLRLYRQEKINERAYNIIKEDLEWLVNH